MREQPLDNRSSPEPAELDRDRFMTAEEAVEWGLIDRILQVREDTTDQ